MTQRVVKVNAILEMDKSCKFVYILTNQSKEWGYTMSVENTRILIVGAGVIGSIYAINLSKAGCSITM